MADRVRRPLICARNVAAPNRGLCLNVPECRSNNSVSLEVDLQSRTGFFLVLTKSGAIRFVDWVWRVDDCCGIDYWFFHFRPPKRGNYCGWHLTKLCDSCRLFSVWGRVTYSKRVSSLLSCVLCAVQCSVADMFR